MKVLLGMLYRFHHGNCYYIHVHLHLNRFSAMTGVYYMYVIKFVPSHLRDSRRTVVGHLRDLELGEGHEFKSHLELGFFGDF